MRKDIVCLTVKMFSACLFLEMGLFLWELADSFIKLQNGTQRRAN